MPRVNIVKQIKSGDRWRLVSIPRDAQGRQQWKALPEGLYFIEWHEGGKRKRQAAGITVVQAQQAARHKRHLLEGKALSIPAYPGFDEELERTPLHIAIKRYLNIVEGLKKPNTFRKYRAVLNRFLNFCGTRTNATIMGITTDDLNEFMIWLKRTHRLDNNTIIHNMVIVGQFLKKHGRPGMTGKIELPQRIDSLPEQYTDSELKRFFGACEPWEKTLYSAFVLTGFREMEVVHLFWEDINPDLHTIKVVAKPDLGFYPKRWEEREVPVPKQLIEMLDSHPHMRQTRFVFPSPRGNREYHLLDKSKAIAQRAGLEPERFHLRKFRSTFATPMLRAGFDVRTVQHWMGHKSLNTTMRYLAPAQDVQERLDKVRIAGVLGD